MYRNLYALRVTDGRKRSDFPRKTRAFVKTNPDLPLALAAGLWFALNDVAVVDGAWPQNRRSRNMAAKTPKTKTQILAKIAEDAGITKKQAVAAMESLLAMAYKGAKDGFTVPGLGKLVLVNRKARMGRNPATGEVIKIKAKKVVKFRVAKACKDAVLN